MSKESKEFEQRTQAVFNTHCVQLGYANVEGSKKYKGKCSGRWRQVDAVAHKSDKTVVPIECKCLKRKVSIEDLDKFHSVAHSELEASEGIMVSSLGFDAGAKAAAKGYNLMGTTLNIVATKDDHNLKIFRVHLGGVNDHFWAVSEVYPISDENACLQSTPVIK